jgi:hypothetical protein
MKRSRQAKNARLMDVLFEEKDCVMQIVEKKSSDNTHAAKPRNAE